VKFLAKKILLGCLTVLATLILTFILLRSMPGDVVTSRAMEMQVQQGIPFSEAMEIAKAQMNYDPTVPMHLQFVKYFLNLVQGNLGESLTYRVPVWEIIRISLPWTLFLCTFSLVFSFAIGCFAGLAVAWFRRYSWLDPLTTLVAAVTQAVPDFLIAVVLLVIFGINLRWFPLRGAYSIDVTPGFNFAFVLSVLYHAILPAAAYLICTAGGTMLGMKASATNVLSEDYMNAARAKGLKDGRILTRYLGRNAIIPMIPGFIVSLGSMLGGSIFTETIFGYPGIGFFFGKAVATRDFVLMQGLLLLSTITIIFLNIFADFIYSRIDPRIKLE
jgi:peptide/nickel transport system permease protein